MTNTDRIKCGFSLVTLVCLFWVPATISIYYKVTVPKTNFIEHVEAEYYDYFNYLTKCWKGLIKGKLSK